MKVVKKTEISYNIIQFGLKMCKFALAQKLNSVLKLKIGISESYLTSNGVFFLFFLAISIRCSTCSR